MSKNNNIPPGAVQTLTDLKVWAEERKPEHIRLEDGHPLTSIREFNRHKEFYWNNFCGLDIIYDEKK